LIYAVHENIFLLVCSIQIT